jgi:hypothetical protein
MATTVSCDAGSHVEKSDKQASFTKPLKVPIENCSIPTNAFEDALHRARRHNLGVLKVSVVIVEHSFCEERR